MFRWKKDYDRLQKLEKYFPIEKPKNFVEKRSKYIKSEMEKKIYDYVVKRDDVIFFGDIAYYAYMKSSGHKNNILSKNSTHIGIHTKEQYNCCLFARY
jgi:hypothetical protein